MNITKVSALEVLDSRGKPTVKAYITLSDGTVHSAAVPSGASTGAHEAVELRDGDMSRHLGQGVLRAVENVNMKIAPLLVGADPSSQEAIDKKMIELDGTSNKGNLGANAILAVSMAVARAGAHTHGLPLWQYLNSLIMARNGKGDYSPRFPRLMVNVVNGGKHAGWNFDIQEFMIVPTATDPSESTKVAAEIFQSLGKELKGAKLSTLVGDEGGYSPALKSNEEVLQKIEEAAKKLKYENGEDYRFALDCASTEFYKDGAYVMQKTGETLSPDKLIEYYTALGKKYKIESFEDPFAEDDWASFIKFMQVAEQQHFQVVGDDEFVTNPARIEKGIAEKAANSVLVKLNQIGSLSETIDAIAMTRAAGWTVIISHRSGETEDAFIADLAYGVGADFIKTGSMSRSDRLAKYNRLLEIEANL